MASIRRTLSPVPRAGAGPLQNGETHMTPSPLSKSSYSQSQLQPSGGLLSTLFGKLDSHPVLYRIHTLFMCMLSQRSSRERSKSKGGGPLWRRAFFHFFICFMVGIFVGLTPFVSMNLSLNIASKHHAFSFEVVSPTRNALLHDGISRNDPHVQEDSKVDMGPKEKLVIKRIFDDVPIAQAPVEDVLLTYQKPLIIVTPTHARPFQAYYLNRLAHTLKLVPPPLLWIVVEMSSQSAETAGILRESGVMYRHLVCDKNVSDIKDRGVHQRNVALSHIETHRLDGIVYFADDNNVYSVELFEHIREIRRLGTWPVAMLMASKNKAVLEGPVCNGSQVNGWHTINSSRSLRRFYAVMSGFAFNSTILWDPKRWHRPTLEPVRLIDTVKEGFQETTFIEQVVEDESQMEGLMDCSRIMVWSLNLEAPLLMYPHGWLMKKNLDVVALLEDIAP